ncbi:MAG: division/cell wall cluster transcriptional repressor MraZ [Ruminococcaceae bacterium]|nr:division/cell wall cluster transcriptional repressor MraZ [Oscillospiraceae bacterium]
MLMGKFAHTLDAKKRLFIPAKHREQLGESFVITRNVDKCLSVFSMEEWEKYTDKLEQLPSTQAREIARFIYSNAAEVQPDGQGRVLIPAELLDYAGITKNAVIIGCGRRSEIWSEEIWNERNSCEATDSLTEMMINLGF